MLKVFRRLEEGTSPTLEVGRFLTEREFAGAAPIVGHVEYRRPGKEPSTLSVLYQYVPNHGDAWQYTLDQLSSFFERVAALSKEQPPQPGSQVALVGANGNENQADIGHELVGGYLETARRLGQNAADLHLALAGDPANLAFAPEPISRLYLRSLYQSMRNLAGKLFGRLEGAKNRFAEPVRSLLDRLLELHDAVLKQFGTVLDSSITGYRIRCHGNYHLLQLLYTGKDFLVTDFERATSQTIGERRIKRSPLRDVASMVRSFDYAVMSVLFGLANSKGRPPGVIRPEDLQAVQPWAVTWYNLVAQAYVGEYLKRIEPAGLLPAPDKRAGRLLDVFLLEQALREVDFELSNRPDWVTIPLHGALRLLGCDPINPVIAL
jgi:maltose alpha-D-glucosyltransferase/alpha-amylase